jgi:hypothetical protein
MNIKSQKSSMEHETVVQKRYRQADAFERLCMYLQYRNMRDDFMEIEFKDSLSNKTSRRSA